MKQVILIIICASIFSITRAQNMVPNGDFEYYTTCPISISQTANCTGWRQYHGSTPDYFNNCASGGNVKPPTVYSGWQYPASGNGFMGGYSWNGAPTNPNVWTEYIAAPIIPLSIGIIYEVSMSVSLANNAGSGHNGLGVWFYDIGPSTTLTTAGSGTLPAVPQIQYSNYGTIMDTLNWVRVVDTFTADSAYDNIVIGKFNPSIGLSYTNLTSNGGYSYYYFDSIVVRRIDHIGINYVDTLLCAGDTIKVPFTVYPINFFNATNVFTLQLSNSTGSFINPVNIGTLTATSQDTITGIIPSSIVPSAGYKLRIIASNPGDSAVYSRNIGIGDANPTKPLSTNNGPLCSGTTLNLTASTTTIGVNWSWTGPNGFTSTLQNPAILNSQSLNSGSYIVTASLYGCRSMDTTNVVVIQSPSPFSAGSDQVICIGDTINLIAYTTQSGVSFSWTGPNNFVSTFANPILINATPSIAGNYIVTASLNGCMLIDTTNITVISPPMKPSASNNGPLCSGNTLSFTATTSTSGVNWLWSGPNGFNSNQQNPSIVNAQTNNSGSYVVTAYTYGCQSKDTTIVMVNQTPQSLVVGSNSSICENDTLRLTSVCGTSGVSYSWTGPNSYSSSIQNPVIIHPPSSSGGDYIVTATLGSCTSRDTVAVLIKPIPAGLTKSSNSPVCIGDTLKLYTSSSTTGVTYLWSGPNAYATFQQNPVILNATTLNAGNYIISYLLNGCDARDTLPVAVNTLPGTINAGSNSPLCADNTLSLTANPTGLGFTFAWTGPNSFNSTLQNPAIPNAQTGASGDYILTATYGGCKLKDTVTILVKPLPANINASNNGPVCQGATLSLAGATTSSGVSYSWVGPNSYSSSLQNPSVTNAQPAATGDYIITYTINGCAIKDTTSAIVYPIPNTPNASHNSPLCTGETLQLSATAIAGATYSWIGPGYSSGIQNPSIGNVQAINVGTYYVRVSVNGCNSAFDSTIVTINPSPNISIYPSPNDTICQGANVVFVSTISGGGTMPLYQWLKNGIGITGANSSNYQSTTIGNNDVISCRLTNNTTCFTAEHDTSNQIQMTVLPWLAPSVSITSNPATPLSPYQLVTFTASASNAGSSPGYQWQRNGSDVVGATSSTWGTYQLSDNDDISVVVMSSYMCPQPPKVTSNIIKVSVLTGVDDVNGLSGIRIYPNPVTSVLHIEGLKKETVITMMDILGRVIYSTIAEKEHVQVPMEGIASGHYLLKVVDSSGKVINAKIEK